MSIDNLKEDQIKKIKILTENSIDPYPSEVIRTNDTNSVITYFTALLDSQEIISLCGRILSIRDQGGIIFFNLYDGSSSPIQCMYKKESSNLKTFKLFQDVLTVSDFVQVEGACYVTKNGVNSLKITNWNIISKSLRQIPSAWNGIKDEDERYRRRYIEMISNNQTVDLIKKKSIFWNSIREFMIEKGFVEVETPILETTSVGAKARQFRSHHNALDLEVYLRISPELWHKKLIIGGLPKVFEIGRVFRNEGMSPEHAQDYTAFEFYQAYTGSREGIPMVIDLFRHTAKKTFGTLNFKIKDFDVDLGAEWKIEDFSELIKNEFNFDPINFDLEKISESLVSLGLIDDKIDDKRKIIDICWKHIQKKINGPSLVKNIPYFFAPLGKRSKENLNLMDEFKIIIAGSELGHCFNELNDPIDQKDRFAEQQSSLSPNLTEDLKDSDFLEALEYGMPPTFGLGLSERVFSFLANVSIRDAQIFPLMKPYK